MTLQSGINLQSPSAASLIGYAGELILPVMDSLVGAFLFDTSVELSRRNWANGGRDATAVGAPAMATGNHGIKLLQATNYLKTNILEADNMTVMICVENAAKVFWPIGTYLGPRSASDSTQCRGMLIQMTSPASNQAYTGFASRYSGSSGGASTLVSSGTKQVTTGNARIMSIRSAEPAGTITLKDLTDNATAITGTRATEVRDKSTISPFLIGSNYGASDASVEATMYSAFLWNRTLTDAELTSMAAWIRKWEAAHGVTC